jgi:hypothetical protein
MTLIVTDGSPIRQFHTQLKHWKNISNQQQIGIKFVQTQAFWEKILTHEKSLGIPLKPKGKILISQMKTH